MIAPCPYAISAYVITPATIYGYNIAPDDRAFYVTFVAFA
ncbi:hypothetical protein yberc0001_29110 [Yersinia bercovieri ATCC 43970]|uniref:Uncharacterized protein n=1 Tax=Yersinia bercovieri ATCC 43970 TaxID=349968 RepID=A0ABM9Y0M0_YERBE|nr:hypothetical protein yberc0001_29110 [Yersinia bercovieri ATCC 43970]